MYKKLLFKTASTLVMIIALIAFFSGIKMYNRVYKANIFTHTGKPAYIYIPTGATFDNAWDTINKYLKVKNEPSLMWVIDKKKYAQSVKPGRYKIKNGSNNNEVVNKLRAGWQEPLMVTFNNIRLSSEMATRISKQIEASEDELKKLLTSDSVAQQYGFTAETFPCMFIPNSYEFFWTTTGGEFIERMHGEYKKFWNGTRLEKAEKAGLTPVEICTLASIVDEETHKSDEKARIAGVYINRLNKRMRLGADPTVRFAVGDFSLKRVLYKHLAINSPYNTYLYYGLPPGPIRYASISGIDAVLDHEKHKYLYFCAKEDFSGYHNFATNLKDHNAYAARYRRALDKRRIYK
jgi:UPF0755 protein